MKEVDTCFETREDLICGLRTAVELEQTLMLQYLYAAYSIPNYPTGKEYVARGLWSEEVLTWLCGLPDQRLDRGVRGTILQIANEEMIHFLLANNLLLAVGGGFWIGRPDFASAATRFGLPTEAKLEPFSADSVRRFIEFERPASPTVESVSALYAKIRNTFVARPESILVRPGETGNEHHLFLPRKTNKYHPDYHCQVDSLASALFAIQTITEQGEGGLPGDEGYESSHWWRFQHIATRLEHLERNGPVLASYPCVTNPSQRAAAGVTQITDPETLQVLTLFNASFELGMQLMLQHFCLHPRSTLRRSRLMNTSIDVMAYLMAPLGVLLMSLNSGVPGKTAGPSFELPYLLQVIPDAAIAQRHLSQRFLELAENAARCPRVPLDITVLIQQHAELARTLT